MATDEQMTQIEELLAKAQKTIEDGMTARIDAGMAYAVKQAKNGKVYVSDGRRWWKDAQLVRSIDDYGDGLVTVYDYLKHVPLFKLEDIAAAGMDPLSPGELTRIFSISETVIFNHAQRDEKGRQKRTVIEH